MRTAGLLLSSVTILPHNSANAAWTGSWRLHQEI